MDLKRSQRGYLKTDLLKLRSKMRNTTGGHDLVNQKINLNLYRVRDYPIVPSQHRYQTHSKDLYSSERRYEILKPRGRNIAHILETKKIKKSPQIIIDMGSEKAHNYQSSGHKVYRIAAKPKAQFKETPKAPSADSHTEFLCTHNF